MWFTSKCPVPNKMSGAYKASLKICRMSKRNNLMAGGLPPASPSPNDPDASQLTYTQSASWQLSYKPSIHLYMQQTFIENLFCVHDLGM